jgi:hypothetical protein
MCWAVCCVRERQGDERDAIEREKRRQGQMQDFDQGGHYRIVIAYRVQIH